MGWIKVHLDDKTHDSIRDIVADSDEPTHEVAATIIQEYIETNE